MMKAFDLEHYRKTKEIKKIEISVEADDQSEFDDLEKMHAVSQMTTDELYVSVMCYHYDKKDINSDIPIEYILTELSQRLVAMETMCANVFVNMEEE